MKKFRLFNRKKVAMSQECDKCLFTCTINNCISNTFESQDEMLAYIERFSEKEVIASLSMFRIAFYSLTKNS